MLPSSFRGRVSLPPAFVLALVPALLSAAQTRTWTQGDASDYDKAILTRVSLRSDGRVTLAPATKELYDPTAGYLWALARDSKGNLYTGGGAGAKLYRISPDGKGHMMADLDGLEIHAIAIDSRDRVYAATAPDGRVYRIEGNSKPTVFYDPRAKYIWAMVFDPQGDLYIATGDQGEIHRVTPDGKGRVFYRSEETHVRSLAMDRKGNLIAGTDPGGLVIRVSPAGEGFVLYQMGKREVTAVAAAPDGAIYAAGVGGKSTTLPHPPAATPVPPATGPVTAVQRQTQPTPPPTGPVAVVGGTEVWRIDTDGSPRKVWTHAQDVAYTLGFDRQGRALIGSGNKGTIYRIESPSLYTSMVLLPSTQVTALATAPDGRLFAATGNTGKVFELGPGLEPEGFVESDVFDAGGYTLWGRLSFEGSGPIAIATRSGNLDQPQKGWSPWSAAITATKGARVTSPPARFVQWRARLTGAGSLDSVDLAYLTKNEEPSIEEMEATPANYRFPPTPTPFTPSGQTLVLPAIGKRSATPSRSASENTPPMQYAKGYVGVRWSGSDPNGDPLIYTVEIRGVNETEWKPLKEKVSEHYLSFDSTAFPDGEYRVRVTASDAPGNPPGEALTAREESAPFLIDNTPPRITDLTATRAKAHWHASDALNNIAKAEYSVDGGEWILAAPVNKLSDSPDLDYDLALNLPPGEHTIAVRVEDAFANQSLEKTVVK